MVRELRDRNAVSPSRDVRTALLNRIAQKRAQKDAVTASGVVAGASGEAIEKAHTTPLPDSDDEGSGTDSEKFFTSNMTAQSPLDQARSTSSFDASNGEGLNGVLEGLQDLSISRSKARVDKNGGSSSSSSSSLLSKTGGSQTFGATAHLLSENVAKEKLFQGRSATTPVDISSDEEDAFQPQHRAKVPIVPLRRSPRGHRKEADSETPPIVPLRRSPRGHSKEADSEVVAEHLRRPPRGQPKKVDLESSVEDNEVTAHEQAGSVSSGESYKTALPGGDLVLGEGSRKYTLSGKIAEKLYDHQRSGIYWLWALHLKKMGGILGDDMGLGKTMQLAAFFAGLFKSKLIKRAIVVAPKTLLDHWTKELIAVGLGGRTHSFVDASVRARELQLLKVLQMGGILLTTYDMVRCNWKSLKGDVHGRDGYGDTSDDITTWDYLILDEGHLIKNPSTERAKSLRELPSTHRIIISGTPIQNNLKEMWALMDFCCPGLLGDKKEFKLKYEGQIVAGNDKHASDRQKRLGAAVAEELRNTMAPFFLRRMKSEVFPEQTEKADAQTLSRKNDLIIWLELTARQANLYRAFLESEAVENAVDNRNPLTCLSVLKKICLHPSLLTKKAAEDIAEGMEGMLDNGDSSDAEVLNASLRTLDRSGSESDLVDNATSSCKLIFVYNLLEKLLDEGHRTLIFSQTRKILDIIQEEFKERRWDYRRIDGTLKSTERALAVNDFQTDPNIPFFLLTSQVGGLGLTLTAADRVVIIDPAWNPSVDNQSVDRAYRIGQAKDVVVYRLMTCGTVEEKIYRKQVFKGGLFKVATESKNQIRYFSQGELRDLFRVPPTGFSVSVTQQQLAEEHFGDHRTSKELEDHISYIENLSMIAGVSHHDVLYSKAAPALPPAEVGQDDTKASWEPRNAAYRASSRPSREENYVWQESDPAGPREMTHDEWVMERSKYSWLRISYLKDKIQRMAAMLEDEDTLSKLPDSGAKIIQKLKEYTREMDDLKPKAAAYKATLEQSTTSGSEKGRGSENSVFYSLANGTGSENSSGSSRSDSESRRVSAGEVSSRERNDHARTHGKGNSHLDSLLSGLKM